MATKCVTNSFLTLRAHKKFSKWVPQMTEKLRKIFEWVDINV